MHGLMMAPVRGYRKPYHGRGPLGQGRFKEFPLQEDDPLVTVLRSIECNPLRAGLVGPAEQGAWSSVRVWREPPYERSSIPAPVARPPSWIEAVNAPWEEKDRQRL